MKKIFIILCCMLCISAHATEMCARDDTVVIPLDATIVAEGYSFNKIEWIWWINFEYGTIYGTSACLSKKEMLMYNNGIPAEKREYINTSSDELIGASGYYMNADVNPDIPDAEKPDYERRYCFAKLMHPLASSWLFHTVYESDNKCYADCSSSISWTIGYPPSADAFIVKKALFNSIGMTPPWPLE